MIRSIRTDRVDIQARSDTDAESVTIRAEGQTLVLSSAAWRELARVVVILARSEEAEA